MFAVQRALGACLTRTRHSVSCRRILHAPLMRCNKPAIVFHYEERLVHEDANVRQELGKLEGKMKLLFTCKKCTTRNSKLISKLAYNKGVVIVRCDGCKNNHLIADNLGWFSEMHKGINIEKLMAMKGETVRKVTDDVKGYFEAVLREEFNLDRKNSDAMEDSNDKNFTRTDKIETPKES